MMFLPERIKKQVVVLRFHDHAQHGNTAGSMKPLVCEAVGYLVKEDPLSYTVVSWVTDDSLSDENCEGYAILKSTVINIRRLK